MRTYSDHNTTPLIFHNLNRYARLPISICLQAYSIFGIIYGFTWQWASYFDLFFAVLFFSLFTVAFIGCMKWKRSAWYALMALSILGITYNLIYIFLFGEILEPPDYAQPLVRIIGDFCVAIYYLKRKPLFGNITDSVPNSKKEFSEIQPTSTKEEPVKSEPCISLDTQNMVTDDEFVFFDDYDLDSDDEFNFFDDYDLDSDEETSDADNNKQPFEETVPFKLFKRIQFMAEGFCDNSIIFPYGATLKDKEVSYTYVYFLYSTANIQHNYFDRQVFRDALTYIIYTFKTIYDYTDEMLESMYSFQHEKLKSFVTIHDECIRIEESNLFEYTERVIAEFPNASFEDPALADASFAEFFTYALDDIRAFKEENSSFKTHAKEEHTTKNHVLDSTKPKKFFCKENTPLILCIIALLGSLAGNIYQSNLAQQLKTQSVNIQNDLTDALNHKDYYKKKLSETENAYSEIINEYNFFHRFAVITTDYDSYYHSYNCDRIGDDGFYIFNVENAKYQAIRPCPNCSPPQ